MDKSDKLDALDKSDKLGNLDQLDKSDQLYKLDKSGKSNRSEKLALVLEVREEMAKSLNLIKLSVLLL